MRKDWNDGQDSDNYHFMRETIKKKPVDKQVLFQKVVGIVGGGLLFGLCAAVAFSAAGPALMGRFTEEYKQVEDVKLSTPTPEPADPSPAEMEDEAQAAQKPDPVVYLESYEELYREVLAVSEEPRKALVSISGISENSDLLDNSMLSYGDAEGIIFLKSEYNMYILTDGTDIGNANKLQISFVDESIAEGFLCRMDRETGLCVVRVPMNKVSDKTQEAISVATLSNSYSLQQAKPVIAIGSPAGDHDAVMYGVVTSTTGELEVADGVYNFLATDMEGSKEGTGVLLDTSGEVIGFILKEKDKENNTVRALSIPQLRPLIERLSNCEPTRYLGIRGATITAEKAAAMSLLRGVYVESVDKDSPAMEAGIQNGDIIRSLNGEPVKHIQAYNGKLQKLESGQKAVVTVARKSADNQYVDMDLIVTIEER